MRIVHRNVSLPNILVTVGGAVKLIDFIMAKGSFTDRMAISFVAPATARGYPAPELAENSARATEEVDVYSLGHVLHHLLTGSRMNLIGVEESHDRDAALHLDNLVIGDLPADLAQRVITLVRRMVSFLPTKRPSHREVVSELSDIIKHAGFGADLARFAEDVVAPQYADRELVPPSHHPQWREASFLEEQQPDIPDLDDAITPAIAEQRMRDIVKSNGWSKRIGEIQDLVIASGYRPDEPFLPVLDKALSPSWKFWERPPEADDICAALAMVVQSGSPEVLARARALLKHGSTDVRRAAEFVVAQYEDM
jgi:serine/threonine protein kinase